MGEVDLICFSMEKGVGGAVVMVKGELYEKVLE